MPIDLIQNCSSSNAPKESFGPDADRMQLVNQFGRPHILWRGHDSNLGRFCYPRWSASLGYHEGLFEAHKARPTERILEKKSNFFRGRFAGTHKDHKGEDGETCLFLG